MTNRALEEKRARFGLVECVNHDLLQPYPVLHEKPGKYIHVKVRLLICNWMLSRAILLYLLYLLKFDCGFRYYCCSYQVYCSADAEWIRPDHISSSTGTGANQNHR